MVGSEGAIRSALIAAPHAFLDASQSERGAFDLAGCTGHPVMAEQVHSARAIRVDAPFPNGTLPQADALVSAVPGLTLGIVTADCAPVLLEDRAAGVVAAAHAGWRGALAGIVANTVAEMVALGARAERIVAAIGPCIAAQSYEVDEAMRSQFDSADQPFFSPGREGRYQFDLPGYTGAQLARAGVRQIDALGLDTYGDPDRFHSYRRATHRGEATKGRQISVIKVA